ncbi:MBL fold metallo-hydrolase [Candidatus Peregrinibacteria bacterium CG10_big_fil_rev_8_21_14_0_10_36_19]|nr:MAG: MBL fold metallo-hydrolase [Candidatus Peregrinibacteria bacterium CG10_big_fil_rev_8_21_14_0_10_36_19]
MIRQIPIQGFDNNFSYFIENGKDIAVVDPGDTDHLISEIRLDGLNVKMILLTHSHFDHVSGVQKLVERFGVPVYVHKHAAKRLNLKENMTVFIDEGDILRLDGLKIKVLYTPGHIDDAVCFYIEEHGHLITGDTLFVEGCGRADLEGSNVEDLWESLQRIMKLPQSTKVYPGHHYGSIPISTIGFEKANNRFFKCKDFEEFRKERMGY